MITNKSYLIVDSLFPTKYSKWRIEEIKSFISEKNSDILVFKVNSFANITFDVDYEYMSNYYNLSKYNILIFDSAYNYLNKYNTKIDGTKYNNKFFGSYLFTKKTDFDINKYDVIYHIFLFNYLMFNSKYNVSYDKQCIHLYPGGGCDNEQAIETIEHNSHIITTQPFIYDLLKRKKYTNIINLPGSTMCQKNTKLISKINHNNKLTVCFSSMGGNAQKGTEEYINLVKTYQEKYKNTVNFISIGNCPEYKDIKNYKIMPYDELDKFYKEQVDIIINFETGIAFNGFPLGIEAALQGAILITTDTKNSNKKFKFSDDEMFIIKNYSEAENIIRKLDLDRKLLLNTSKKSQKKLFEFFSYKSQQQKIFEYLDCINKPEITTIILTYNHGRTIERAIKSVLKQKCKYNHKIIIQDDSSTDKTIKICKKYKQLYPDQITLNSNKKNIGANENYKNALNEVKTKYTAYLEGDDYWIDILKLEKQIDILEKNTECLCCIHNTSVICTMNNKNTIDYKNIELVLPKKLTSGIYNINTFESYLSHPSSRVYNTFLLKNALINLQDYGDKCMQIKLLSLGDLYYLSDIMSVYNITGKGIWTSLTPQERCKAVADVDEYLKNSNDVDLYFFDVKSVKSKNLQNNREKYLQHHNDGGIHFK